MMSLRGAGRAWDGSGAQTMMVVEPSAKFWLVTLAQMAKYRPQVLSFAKIFKFTGESPSGKAAAFGAAIRRFESYLPSQDQLTSGER
jgi:hypothetical protein